eukprot:GSMAST32.ASY1.ANO1.476.1 assembled CDS
MCVQCLRNEVDITEGIPSEVVIFSCRGCARYLGGISWNVRYALLMLHLFGQKSTQGV